MTSTMEVTVIKSNRKTEFEATQWEKLSAQEINGLVDKALVYVPKRVEYSLA